MERWVWLVLAFGALVLVAIGVLVWQNLGPSIQSWMHDTRATQQVFDDIPSATLEDVQAAWKNGRKLLVVQWRGGEDQDEAGLGTVSDSIWAALEPELEFDYDSVVLVAIEGRSTKIEEGPFRAELSNRRIVFHRTYGEPLTTAQVENLLDD